MIAGKKILFIHSCAGLYGADRCLLSICRGLVEAGAEPYVLLPYDGILVKELKKLGANVQIMDTVVFRRDVFSISGALKMLAKAPFSIFRIARFIREKKIDIVYTNTGVAIGGAVAARLTRRPHIWHFRDILTEFGRLLRFYEPFVNLFSTRLIFITKAVGDQFSSAGIRKKGKVIYDGIPTENFSGEAPEHRGSNFIVTSVGRLAPYKGQQVLIEALKDVNDQGVSMEAFIVGDVYAGREAFKEELSAIIRDAGLQKRIHLTGFQQEVQPYLEKCNVFVMPSKRQEPLGIVMLEAMAAKRAVIATNGGGAREIINDDTNGLLVEPGNSGEMAEALIRIARDDDLRHRLASKGYQDVTEKYSEKAMISNIVNFCSDVLDNVRVS